VIIVFQKVQKNLGLALKFRVGRVTENKRFFLRLLCCIEWFYGINYKGCIFVAFKNKLNTGPGNLLSIVTIMFVQRQVSNDG